MIQISDEFIVTGTARSQLLFYERTSLSLRHAIDMPKQEGIYEPITCMDTHGDTTVIGFAHGQVLLLHRLSTTTKLKITGPVMRVVVIQPSTFMSVDHEVFLDHDAIPSMHQ